MRKTTKFLLSTCMIAAVTPASAATFIFSGGSYTPGVTSPSPLLAPDTLDITTAANKGFTAVTFTNQSGTVNWQGGDIFLTSAAALNNQSLWNATGNNSISFAGGVNSTFTNTGTFRKSAGAGNTTISGVNFVNSGTIDAQTGRILFATNGAAFNAGSVFTGAGEVAITSLAAFNGGFTSSNLVLESGTFTGTNAALTGAADWEGGTMAGSWSVAAGSALDVITAGNKILNAATVINDGTINWQAGNMFMISDSKLVNNGTISATSDNSVNFAGGINSTVTNNGVFEKSAGSGDTTISGVNFINSGTIDAQTGRILFATNGAVFDAGSIFTGAGEIAITALSAFNGGFTSSNLVFESGTATGTNAALTGTADFESGTMAGSWNIAAGAALDLTTGGNKVLNAATVTNDGTINWQAGNIFTISDSKLINNATITATSDNSISFGGGVNSTFTNTGTFRKSAGLGDTTISGLNFVNSGTIDAQTGRILFATNGAVFDAGSIFTGAGEVAITALAAFNGGFTSSNLVLESGTVTGTNAALTGNADWESGTMVGSWNVGAGSALDVTTAGNKTLNAATVTNDGTINWQDGNIFMISNSKLVNNGTMTATSNDSIAFDGGAASTFTNNGLIEKTGGSGTTTLASGISLDNNGTINVLSGTIALPSAFTNDGTLGGTGTFTSTNLTNGGIIAPGAPGSTGTLALTGNYAQTAFGTLNTQLASTGSFDLFNISGTAGLNGTLALSCILSCAINTGDSFVILNSVGNLSGTFSNVTTSGFLTGFTYDVIYDYAADLVRLEVINAGTITTPGAVPEPTTWTMMLFGFGLVGSTMRRRTATRVSATV